MIQSTTRNLFIALLFTFSYSTLLAQGPIYFTGSNSICLGDSSSIEASLCNCIFNDNFDPGIKPGIWADNTGEASGSCGSFSGANALYFNTPTATPRQATTIPIDVTAGGIIEFYLKIANSVALGCENAEPGEGVVLEYTNNGANWITINMYDVNLYPVFTHIVEPISAAFMTPTAQFRFRQLMFSGPGLDNWAIDNVKISTGCCDTICPQQKYTWSPSTGISDTTISNPLFYPATTTLYHVSITDTSTGTTHTDSIKILVPPNFNYSVDANEDVICKNQSTEIHITTDTSGSPYNINWTPNPSILGSLTAASILVQPLESTRYYIAIESQQGCLQSDSIDVSVQGFGPIVSLSTSHDTICPGDTVLLQAELQHNCYPFSNQAKACPPNSTLIIDSVGNGVDTTFVTTPFSGKWEDSRTQILYRPEDFSNFTTDIIAIKQISLHISNKKSSIPYNDLQIKMRCTDDTAMSSTFIEGLELVHTDSAFITDSGWVDILLDFPYNWDGSSNLVVEICYNNVTWTDDDFVYMDTTSYFSVRAARSDNQFGCDLFQGFISDLRPQTRFEFCTYDIDYQFQWNSDNGNLLCDSCNPTEAILYQPTNFVLSASDSSCSGNGFISVESNNALCDCPTAENLNAQTSPTTVTLAWDSLADAVSYIVYIDSGSSLINPDIYTTNLPSIYIDSLDTLVTYIWQVQAICIGDTAFLSLPSIFITGVPAACLAPGNPIVAKIADTSATLSWDSNASSIMYTVQLALNVLDSANSVFITSNTNSIDLIDLLPNSLYIWQVKTSCTYKNQLTSFYSEPDSFYTLVSGQDPLVENNILLFPNPTRDKLHVVVPHEGYSYIVADMGGKELIDGKSSQLQFEIEVTTLPIGIYQLILEHDGKRYIEKVVIY